MRNGKNWGEDRMMGKRSEGTRIGCCVEGHKNIDYLVCGACRPIQ